VVFVDGDEGMVSGTGMVSGMVSVVGVFFDTGVVQRNGDIVVRRRILYWDAQAGRKGDGGEAKKADRP
jgi:hypothetical protein